MPMWKPVAKWSPTAPHVLRNAACSAIIGGSLLASGVAAQATISGVCPDGSIFIVQRISAIPCADAKQVDPSDVPPLNPELLPRPYGWEQFRGRQDPNNPYNVVDSAPTVKRVGRSTRRGPNDQQPVPGTGNADRDLRTRPTLQPESAPGPRDEANFDTVRVNPLSAAHTSATTAGQPTPPWFSSADLNDLTLIVARSDRHE